jgi:hypothetical protein
MLIEIRATNSGEKMQLMDELKEGHSPPEKLRPGTHYPNVT